MSKRGNELTSVTGIRINDRQQVMTIEDLKMEFFHSCLRLEDKPLTLLVFVPVVHNSRARFSLP